mmetsp:Transcript_6324/g.13480  ORF Transcript_6324/g.13480 Transcript_6324/m.13480 type:complete len:322 (+) Transcript_6324:151-1116(+)|eukprot:CAMPEP_0185853222 /NCGR_PEP_ID=MMETSP1354-20130828/18123_1 /TAXON_ID=708628 /ORGANISM="Erythrolobus madagascarensis, Strain CCMP3276" /LENGTH=321 /DNA_ID=CAMNT_0028554659 /DNA_START=78 /DNA_END=1043 /DNA_ORIENTATION=+
MSAGYVSTRSTAPPQKRAPGQDSRQSARVASSKRSRCFGSGGGGDGTSIARSVLSSSSSIGSRVPLDVEVAAFCIPRDNREPSHSIISGSAFALVDCDCSHTREECVSALWEQLQTTRSVNSRLSRALSNASQQGTRTTASISALLAEFGAENGVLRVASTGLVGLCVIRERDVVFRSYQVESPEVAFEHTFESAAWEGQVCSSADVESTFFEMEDGDLLVAGSPELFANVSEEQMLSFVRPVPPDAHDSTLALANATCLASFRTDDVEFISYYLAHLAYNFATSSNAKQLTRFPFPPGTEGQPYFRGDVTVIAASCSSAS